MNSSDRKLFIFIVICTLGMVIFGYTWKNRTEVPHISAPLINVTTPFFYGSEQAFDKVRSGVDIIDNLFTKEEEIKKLEAQIAEAKVDEANYKELVAENIRLRQMLRFKTSKPQLNLAAAHIIGRDFGYGLKTLTIDIGANQGIARYMPVVAPGGVVGFISDVFANSARVQSLLDPRTAVGVIVQRPESRLVSIAKGSVSSPTQLQLVDIPKDADVLQGDTLITSGFGGVYPKGLIVGYVGKVETNSEGYVNYVNVQPAVDFYRLEEVFVLVGNSVPSPIWVKKKIKLIPTTNRDQVQGVKGAINNETH